MVRAGVQNTHGIAAGRQIQRDLLHFWMGGVGKINGHYAAHGGGGLIHQAAGLAEKHILRILPDLGNFHGGTPVLPKQAV